MLLLYDESALFLLKFECPGLLLPMRSGQDGIDDLTLAILDLLDSVAGASKIGVGGVGVRVSSDGTADISTISTSPEEFLISGSKLDWGRDV